jgi:hypothetical protein
MEFEYTIKMYSMEQLTEKGIIVDPGKNIVYACGQNGACEVRDVSAEQAAQLSSLFNEMGKEGWELLQLVFRPSGIVSYWKRNLKREN